MRTHKSPVGSLTWHLSNAVILKSLTTPLNKGVNLREFYYNFVRAGVASAYTCMARYELSRYLKHSPSDILLDKSVLDFIESHPMEDKINLPNFHQLWVDLSKFDMVLQDDTGVSGKVNGVLFVKPDSFGEDFYKSTLTSLMSSFTVGDQIYCAWVMCGTAMVQLPFGSDTTYEQLLDLNPSVVQNMNSQWKSSSKSLGRFVAIAIMALHLIEDGHFTRESSVYQDSRLPLPKKPKGKKRSKGAKFKQRYREFRITRFVHIESEPNPNGSSSYTPPEHYSPRNVRSHYKERWVTLDYIEKYQVPDEDIIELEDRTRLYKNGEGTKLWGKIKLWYEYKQDPNLAPTQEIERYRV